MAVTEQQYWAAARFLRDSRKDMKRGSVRVGGGYVGEHNGSRTAVHHDIRCGPLSRSTRIYETTVFKDEDGRLYIIRGGGGQRVTIKWCRSENCRPITDGLED